jgi:hypothetical protein
MFARKATFRDVDRVHNRARVVPLHSNDNHVHPTMVTAPDAGRLALVCHWHLAPGTGKPECNWRIERGAQSRSGSEREP